MKRPGRLIAPILFAALTLGLGEVQLVAQVSTVTVPQMLAKNESTPTKPPAVKITLSPDGQTVYVVGMLLDGAFHQFDAVLLKAPLARRVHLSSAGGYTLEARLMAALVRKRKLDTYVETYCASACTQVFAAGRSRVVGPAAQLGFHQASLVDESSGETVSRAQTNHKLTATTVFGVNGNDTLRLAYELAGTDPAFTEKALGHSHESMWLPTHQELLAARIVTRVAETSEWPLPPGGGGTRAEVRSRLLGLPLWAVALVRIPDTAESAVDEVWRAFNSGADFDQAVMTGRSKLVVNVTKALAEATDPLLDRSLTLYAGSARNERSRGYPGCKSAIGVLPAPSEEADLLYAQQEDALIIDFLTSPDRSKRMGEDEATRYFSKEVIPLISSLFRPGSTKGQEGKCRLGLQMFETIDAMPVKKRIKAYRALLSLPGMAEI